MSTVITKVMPIIQPLVDQEDCELVDIEYVKEGPSWYLRIYCDKLGGITLDDCVRLSEIISEGLDAMEADPFPKEYFLEVSSPGAERPLKTEQAIQNAIGKYVHFDYYVKQYGEKWHEGTLLAVNEDTYTIEVTDKTRKKQLEIAKEVVAKARLAVKV